jgi:hypothetical protein
VAGKGGREGLEGTAHRLFGSYGTSPIVILSSFPSVPILFVVVIVVVLA